MNTSHPLCLVLIPSLAFLGCAAQPSADPVKQADAHVDPFDQAAEVPASVVVSVREEEITPAQQQTFTESKPLPRPEILAIADLPSRIYVVDMTATEFMQSDEAFGAMADQLAVHIESDIETYDIRDKAGLKQLHSTLMNIAIMQGRYDDARSQIELIRLLESNPTRKETTGLMMRAIVDSWQQGGRDNPASSELFARNLRQQIDAMPWDVIEVDIKARLQSSSQMNPVIFETIISTGLDPMFKDEGQFNSTIARQLVSLKSIMDIQMPVMDQATLVYQDVVIANTKE
jgi:hypothetical protein